MEKREGRSVAPTCQNLKVSNNELFALLKMSGKSVFRYNTKTRTIYTLCDPNGLYNIPGAIENFPESVLKPGIAADGYLEEFRTFCDDMCAGIPCGRNDFLRCSSDGGRTWLRGEYTLIPDENGEMTIGIITVEDVTAENKQKHEHDRRLQEVEAIAGNCAYYIDGSLSRGVVENIKGTGKRMMPDPGENGYPFERIFGERMDKTAYPDDRAAMHRFFDRDRLVLLYSKGVFTDKIEYRTVHGDEIIWYQVSIYLMLDDFDNDIRFYVLFKDIDTERSEREALLIQATTDEVTGLLDRGAVTKEIEDYLQGEGVYSSHALIIMDMDDFKTVNDTLGHQIGDEALRHIASTMKRCFRSSDVIGRLGGDEFFVLLKNITVDLAERKVNELQREVQCVFAKDGKQVNVTCSAGIAMYRGDIGKIKSLDQLYAEADAALYRVKASGKNSYAFAEGSDAVDTPDASSEGIANNLSIAFDLRSLLNNFANGIEIYHGEVSNDNIAVVFCNEGFLEMMGLSMEEYTERIASSTYYFVHPDDRKKVIDKFSEAIKSYSSFKVTYRLRTANDIYRWVTVFGSVNALKDGGFDCYIIYSDAEQTEMERKLHEERYRGFAQKIAKTVNRRLAAVYVNFTENTCTSIEGFVDAMRPIDIRGTVEKLFSDMRDNIPMADARAEFEARFSPEKLTKLFASGIFQASMTVPLTLSTGKNYWYSMMVEMAQNPETQDIEAIISVIDNDREIRLKYAVDWFANSNFEFIGQIDVNYDLMTVIGGGTEREKKMAAEAAASYADTLSDAVHELISAEYFDQAMEEMNLDRVKKELETSDVYVCTYPARSVNGKHEILRQWRFGYIGTHREVIMLTRTDMTTFLNSERAAEVAVTNRYSVKAGNGQTKANKILIVDDSEINRNMLGMIFEDMFEIIQAADSDEAIERIDEHYDELALILLDLNMLCKKGLHVLMHMSLCGLKEKIPVIMIADEAAMEANLNSYEYGIADIVNKPYDARIVKRRALNIIEQFARKRATEDVVEERTEQFMAEQKRSEQNYSFLISALSSVVEFRNLASDLHIKRVQALSEILLKAWNVLYPDCGFDEKDISEMIAAAALHDIGKIAIPDEILLKPGRLTDEEFDIVKTHTTRDCDVLEQFKKNDNSFYRYCYDICRHHHERYDGQGYPDGLKGDEISVCAQIVSIVDVFDALINERVYRPALPVDEAIRMIESGECGQFSPKLLKCFAMAKDEIIKTSLSMGAKKDK